MLSLAFLIVLTSTPPALAPPDSIGPVSPPPALQGLSAGAFT